MQKTEIRIEPHTTQGVDGDEVDTGQYRVIRGGQVIGFVEDVDGATLFIHRRYPVAVLDDIDRQVRELIPRQIAKTVQLPPPPDRQRAGAEDFPE